jgi:ApbE superfamily uncharacterized protein (UPF0280 family)
MPGAQARLLQDGRRLHLQHGPIDIILEGWGEPPEMAAAYRQAATAFVGLLGELAAELPLLRRPIQEPSPAVEGPVARRMVEAVWPHRAVFVTPMAAVAGAVADHLLHRMLQGRRLTRAYVNDGGDIALHLVPGTALTLGAVADIEQARLDGLLPITAADPIRGVATSGRSGRSFSLGIADAVTVLARNAAEADAAATLVANAVDLDHPAIERRPAVELDPDSDLGDRPVTLSVGPLPPDAVEAALTAGAAEAERMRARGLIVAAGLWLHGTFRTVGPLPVLPCPA